MPRRSPLWTVAWRVGYAILRRVEPIVRRRWRAGQLGITVELTTRGRRSGRQRSVLVGLLRIDDRMYVGHPNGAADWTRNLQAAGDAEVRPWTGPSFGVRAERLPHGSERDAVVRATAVQQPFPGKLLYRASRNHVLAVGTYFRLTPA
jgi:deazaflavin-dependent oxidoreductase (nitroreductase family)